MTPFSLKGIFTTLCLSAFSLTAQADPTPAANAQDPNRLLTDEDLAVAVLHHQDKQLAEADTLKKDGLLSAAEIELATTAFKNALLEKAKGQEQRKKLELDKVFQRTAGKPVTAKKGYELIAIDQPDKDFYEQPLWGIQIRRSAKDIDVKYSQGGLTQDAAKDRLLATKPAEFSFAHNGLTDEETWIARGIIARPFLLTEGGQSDWTGAFVPSANFERVSNKINKAAEIDKLTLTAAFTAITPGYFFDGLSDFDFGFDYTTNFDFDGAMYSGHLTWMPTLGSPTWWPNIDPIPLWEKKDHDRKPELDYRLRQYAHLEGGGTDSLATTPVQGDFLRIGGGIGGDLIYRLGDREITLSVDYRYYAGLLSSDHDHRNFRAALTVPVDDQGHITLQAAYEKGQVSLTQQDLELITVGLGVRF